MPYKSGKQRRFFKMCEHSPGKARGKCPPKKVLSEYSTAEKRKRK